MKEKKYVAIIDDESPQLCLLKLLQRHNFEVLLLSEPFIVEKLEGVDSLVINPNFFREVSSAISLVKEIKQRFPSIGIVWATTSNFFSEELKSQLFEISKNFILAPYRHKDILSLIFSSIEED